MIGWSRKSRAHPLLGLEPLQERCDQSWAAPSTHLLGDLRSLSSEQT